MGCGPGSSSASRLRVGPPVSDREARSMRAGMSTVYSEGLACVFVFACTTEILLRRAYKNHDSPAAGGPRRRAKHGQHLDFKLLHKGTTACA